MPSHVGYILSFTYMEVHSRVLWLLRARGCKQLLAMNTHGKHMAMGIYINVYMCESYIYIYMLYIYMFYMLLICNVEICY